MKRPADLFVALWQALDARIDEVRQVDELNVDEDTLDALGYEAATILGVDGSGLAPLRDWASDDIIRIIAAAQSIDEWYQPLAMEGGGGSDLDEPRTEAKHFYRAANRLNSDDGQGQVILRRPLWGRWADPSGDLPGGRLELSDFFNTLILVPAFIDGTHPDRAGETRSVRLRFKMRPAADARALNDEQAWKIGFAPIAEDEHDLELAITSLDGQPAYDAQVARLDARIEKVVEVLCAHGCHIIAFPELTLHPQSLETLKGAIRTHGPASALALVLAGTQRIMHEADAPPHNEAIVLDHVGEEVFRQRKLSRWNLEETHRSRYDITVQDPCKTVYEYITPGDELLVVEQANLGRMAVLVCEDLSRSEPGRWVRANMLLDLQFTPVMDSHLDPSRWMATSGSRAAKAGRCRVLVSNSLPLTHRQNRVNTRSRTGPIVDRCGIGLAVDIWGDDVRCAISEIPVVGPAGRTALLHWETGSWPSVPGALGPSPVD